MRNQMTLAEALIGLQKIKDKIELHEMANDMYYSSAQHVEDEQELNALERRLRELKEQEDEPSLLDLCKELKEMAQ